MPEHFNDPEPSPLVPMAVGFVIGATGGIAVGLFLGVLFVGRVG